MEQLTHFFTDPRFVWACVGFLLLLAIVTCVLWLRHSMKAISAFRGAIVTLKTTEGATEFAANYHDLTQKIGSELNEIPTIRTAWNRWSNSFRTFVRADGAQVVAAEKPAGEFFTLAAWERGLAMHWYQALPNYLVGLGLCFTFFGVIIVISAAAKNLGADPLKQSEHLQELLSAASVKFMTSLAAVFASVFYSLAFRWRRNAVERNISELVAELSRRVFILNPTALMLEIREENQRQTACLETMATNIGVTVGEQFAKSTQVMGDALSRLEATVHALGESMGQKSDAVQRSIDGLSGGIVDATSKDLEKLAASVVGALDNTLKEHFHAIANSLKETCGEVEATREAFSEMVGHTRRTRDEFATLADEIKARTVEVSDLLLKAEEEIEDRLHGAASSAKLVESSIAAAAENAAGMESLGAGLARAASAVESAATDWRSMGSEFGSLSVANSDASEQVRSSIQSLREQWELQGSRISEIDSQLAATISAVQSHFDGYAQRLHDYTQELDSQLGRAVGSFSASIDSLSDAPERFGDAGEQLLKAAQKAVESLSPLKNLSGIGAALEPLKKLEVIAVSLAASAEALRDATTTRKETES